MPDRHDNTQQVESERAEADLGEHLVERNSKPPVAIEEEQQPEDDERDPRDALDRHVVRPNPPEGAHRVSESHTGEDERRTQAERVGEQERDATQDRPA